MIPTCMDIIITMDHSGFHGSCQGFKVAVAHMFTLPNGTSPCSNKKYIFIHRVHFPVFPSRRFCWRVFPMNVGEKTFSHHMNPLLGGADHVWSTMARTGTSGFRGAKFHLSTGKILRPAI